VVTLATPEWLSSHAGELRPGSGGHAYLVYFDGQPQYVVRPTPAAGKFGCDVVQTINGQRVESGGSYATENEAASGGLEDLRKFLGW
jgi:hypothetical protein